MNYDRQPNHRGRYVVSAAVCRRRRRDIDLGHVAQMRLLDLHYNGGSYGRVWTSVPSNHHYVGEPIIIIERLPLPLLATLTADILGEDQPYTRHEWRNLALWLLRYGASAWGERVILRQVARALVWRKGMDHETRC